MRVRLLSPAPTRARSSVDRAPVFGTGRRGFESLRAHERTRDPPHGPGATCRRASFTCRTEAIPTEAHPEATADRRLASVGTAAPEGTGPRSGFQQLRDRDYEVVACLGLSPSSWHCWFVPKAALWGHARPQHGGRAGNGTRWPHVDPTEPPTWIGGYGGSDAIVLDAIETTFGPRRRQGAALGARGRRRRCGTLPW